MSNMCRKLCSSILCEHFGQIVQHVGDDLLKYGPKTLSSIRQTTGLPLPKIKEALCVLIKYDFVQPKLHPEKGMDYSIDYEKVLMILRYPKYMFFTKTICGDECEMMLEEVLKHGYMTASEIIIKVHKRIEQSSLKVEPSIPNLRDKLELLITNQILIRSSYVEVAEVEEKEKANKKANKKEKKENKNIIGKLDFIIPDLELTAIAQKIQGTDIDPGDSKIYWRVNFDRLDQDLRDEIIVLAMSQRLKSNAGELMKELLFLMFLRTLSWTDTSNPIPLTEIKDRISKGNYSPLLTQDLDQYLVLIVEDTSQFLSRVGDAGGGQYSVNMKQIFNQLAWTTLFNNVMERFGSKAARIFRLVRDNKHIEQERIQHLAMLPAKEAKYFTYTLFQENYLQIQEMKRPGVSANPIKTLFMYHIDMNMVVRKEVEHCYHALYNTMQRREYEVHSNRRMIDKQLRVQTLTSNMEEHGATTKQLEDVAETITPSEKQQLEKVQLMIKKLGGVELQIEETLFILTMYLRYHND